MDIRGGSNTTGESTSLFKSGNSEPNTVIVTCTTCEMHDASSLMTAYEYSNVWIGNQECNISARWPLYILVLHNTQCVFLYNSLHLQPTM